MIIYALPLMIAGFAGMINETFDRILLPILIPDKSTAMEQIGIYGACYKLSILMTLFVQTFRYAAEPFFFSHSSKENAREVYSRVMHYFVIVCSFIFLAIMMYIDIVKYFIGSEYRSGLKVVPVLLMANLCLGVYYNLSIWYKLTGQTKWGAWLSMFGAVITLALNFWWIPIIGQKYYSVPYHIRSFLFYISSAPIFYIISTYIRQTFELSERIVLLINTGFVFVFIVAVFVFEGGKNSYLRIPLKKGSQ
jgi:O-antigen/teichoic acid export membrane protein